MWGAFADYLHSVHTSFTEYSSICQLFSKQLSNSCHIWWLFAEFVSYLSTILQFFANNHQNIAGMSLTNHQLSALGLFLIYKYLQPVGSPEIHQKSDELAVATITSLSSLSEIEPCNVTKAGQTIDLSSFSETPMPPIAVHPIACLYMESSHISDRFSSQNKGASTLWYYHHINVELHLLKHS